MKNKVFHMLWVGCCCLLLQGCISIPPLIQVQHKDDNGELFRRLDAIDRRLDQLERQASERPHN